MAPRDDLKCAEAKLRQDEEELRRITDLISQQIVVLSPEGKAIYANRVSLEYPARWLPLSSLVTRRGHLRVQHNGAWVVSKRQMVAPSSWMRSATSPRISRSHCYERCKNVRSNAPVATHRSRWT